MSIAAAIEEMIAEGFTLEQAIKAAKIVEACIANEPPNRSPRAARQARWREKQRLQKRLQASTERLQPDDNVVDAERLQTSTKASTGVYSPRARVEDSSTNIEVTGKKKNNSTRERNGVTPRDVLLECLQADTADALLAHRRAKKCPLTAYAAKLLVKGFNSTADPEDAAQTMIARGWQGFRLDWYDDDKGKRAGRQGKGSIVEAGRKLTERLLAAERERELQAVERVDDGDPAFRFLPTQRRE